MEQLVTALYADTDVLVMGGMLIIAHMWDTDVFARGFLVLLYSDALQNIDLLAPFLCYLFSWSLQHGVVPSLMKAAYITPILKKADMDSADVSPISQSQTCL